MYLTAIFQATSHGSEQDAPFRVTVLDPIGKLNSYYTNINAAITKRSHKVLLLPGLLMAVADVIRR